jgi:hypothetical protein
VIFYLPTKKKWGGGGKEGRKKRKNKAIRLYAYILLTYITRFRIGGVLRNISVS